MEKTEYGTPLDHSMKLNKFLRKERDKRGLSQKEFAELSGISFTMISFIENGKRAGRRTLQKLARTLKVDYLYLHEINNEKERI